MLGLDAHLCLLRYFHLGFPDPQAMHHRFDHTGEPEGKYSTSFQWKMLWFSHRLKFQAVYHILLVLRAVLSYEFKSGHLFGAQGSQRVIPILMGYSQLSYFSLE